MTAKAPRDLTVYDQPTTLSQIAEDQKDPLYDLVSYATGHYGEEELKKGDKAARLIGARMFLTPYRPYMREVSETAKILDMPGIRSLQHSFAMGCSTIVRNESIGNFKAPTLKGTIDWEQVGEDLSSVVSLAVLENPIKPSSPVMSVHIGPAAFGLIMMNKQVAAKINRAPIPNVNNPGLDLSKLTDDDYAEVKKSNNGAYQKGVVLSSVFGGKPSAAYLLRHAMNLDLSFEDTVEFIKNTKICDAGIITVTGTAPSQAVTIEKRGNETHIRNGFEPVANHWDPEGSLAQSESLPRTLNSMDRAQAIADTARPSLYRDGHFGFANAGVIDDTTRVIAELCPNTGLVKVVTTTGEMPTSNVASARFDGQSLQDVEHKYLDLAA